MKTKMKFLLTGVIVLMLLVGITGVALAGPLNYKNIYLNNDTAEEGTDCPATGGPYWHFVISPNNGDSYFITFHLNLGDASTYDTSIYVPNGSQLDNVFVAVPSGKTLTSLIKDRSSADIYWNGDSPEPTKFQLSHVCSGGQQPQDLTVSKTATPSYTRTFGWTIEKKADHDQINTAGSATFWWIVKVTKDAGTDSDWALAGTITVHNPNTFDVEGVDVTDATSGGDCIVTAGTGLTVPAGDDATADYICTFTSNPGSGTNTATATWPSFGSPHTSATGTAAYTFGAPTKLVNNAIDVTDTNGASWHFTASSLTDPYPVTYNDPAGTCTDHTNTATITQTGASASKTVKVCVGADLTVSKTATPAFKRTYAWDISKGVTPTLVEQIGGTATFNYTVKAWQTGFIDSAWVVSGKITVTNPNDWEDITLTNLTDVVDNGGTCTIDAGPYVVPMSDSIDVGYSCTFAAQPAYDSDIVNTATATWDSAKYFTPDGSASGSVDFAFTTPTTRVNKTVTIKDTFNGTTTTLGTLVAKDETPYASATFTYSRTVNVPTWNCLFYTNTAKVIGDNNVVLDQDSKTVEVCGPAKTGALTMGYWQNNNGQGIIKAGASTAGVCNSGTWLRQYAPFQDLSATATCTQVATYVYNMIKAANSSGTSMNAMLKAQMLATALDVYFSDPALGGNKIGAPAPIGGVTIDLTKVCKNIAGGCTIFENVSGAFGGATSLTVSQMLTYAASQSNVGGSLWYGQVKATQELAKDAFDAINNQKVFAP